MQDLATSAMSIQATVRSRITASDPLTVLNAEKHVEEARAFPNVNSILATFVDRPQLNTFSRWQVESHLTQAQELLERNQKERALYDDLRMKALEKRLEIFSEAMELEEIERRLLPTEQPTFRLNQRAEEVLANASDRAKDSNLGLARDPSASWEGVWNHQAAGQQAAAAAHNSSATESMVIDRFRTFLDKRLRDESAPAQRLRAELAKADADRFVNTAGYLRIVANIKAEALNVGGPLDIKSRLKALEKQIAFDFNDAYIRLEQAYKGMIDFFGFSGDALPSRKDGPEDIVVWNRQAISWMVSFSHFDQAVSVVVPLARVAASEWDAKKQAFDKGEEVLIEFRWNTEWLQDYAFVRLTGIALTLQADPACLVEGSVLPPRKARIQLRDGSTPPMDQPVASCRLGRVETRNSSRSPELGGVVSLRNTSPIGDETVPEGAWQVTLKKLVDGVVDDVFVELSLSVVKK